MIFCTYLQSWEAPLLRTPYSDPWDAYLKKNISAKAWQLWKAHQIKIINENRLSLVKQEDKILLKKAMCDFFNLPDFESEAS